MKLLLYLGLNLAVLFAAARLSRGPRWPLFLALLSLGFGIGMANNLIEAIVFGVIAPAEAVGALGFALASFSALSLLAVRIAGQWRAPPAPAANLPITPARRALVVIAYELLYFGAGTMVFPYVADFYATRSLQPFHLVTALQVARSLTCPRLRDPAAAPCTATRTLAARGRLRNDCRNRAAGDGHPTCPPPSATTTRSRPARPTLCSA